MRRYLILARHARHLTVPYWHVLRAAAYLISDECPDQSLIEEVPLLVQEWHLASATSEETHQEYQKIADHFERVSNTFRDSGHRLTELVAALAFQRGDRVFDAAKACGAFPDEIEQLIDRGFIHCSRMRMTEISLPSFDDPESSN